MNYLRFERKRKIIKFDKMPSESAQSVQVLDELFQKLTVSKDGASIKEASGEIASFINGRIDDQAVPDK